MDQTSIVKAVSPISPLKWALATIGIMAASPATASSNPSTRLIRCGDESCLQVSGRRNDPATVISINGHVVPAEGEFGWRVSLPVDLVREWSEPYARTIEVSLHDPETQHATVVSADLPIGLLGGTTDLASLVISAR